MRRQLDPDQVRVGRAGEIGLDPRDGLMDPAAIGHGPPRVSGLLERIARSMASRMKH